MIQPAVIVSVNAKASLAWLLEKSRGCSNTPEEGTINTPVCLLAKQPRRRLLLYSIAAGRMITKDDIARVVRVPVMLAVVARSPAVDPTRPIPTL
jgi:hypothetical protein